VAKLCRVRDFVVHSRASKRLRELFMRRETVSDVIQNGNSALPLCSSKPIVVGTLEQLAFYESAKEHNLLEENRFVYDPHSRDSSIGVISAVRSILREHPSATVELNAHSHWGGGLSVPASYLYFDYRGKEVCERWVTNIKTCWIRQ
jgi:hypothetical protein